MALIKTVTNGDRTVTFKAVSLGHAVAIVFGLVSLLGAQQTWLWSAAHERSEIVIQIRAEAELSRHASEALSAAAFAEVNRRLSDLESHVRETERQVLINTGRIERMR